MNKKTIIEIVVMVVAFGGSGFVLFKGLKTTPPPVVTVNTAASQITNVLPYGSTLDFSVLDKQGFQYGTVVYETVNTSTEVGVNPSTLILPTPVQ